MGTIQFTEEFKIEAAKQITEHQRSVADVAKRLGVSTHSLYARDKRYGKSAPQRMHAYPHCGHTLPFDQKSTPVVLIDAYTSGTGVATRQIIVIKLRNPSRNAFSLLAVGEFISDH